MATMSRAEREGIAQTRILRALGALTVANQRTLEQKISDAGPYNQRVDPHILTEVRNSPHDEGVIATRHSHSARPGTTPATHPPRPWKLA